MGKFPAPPPAPPQAEAPEHFLARVFDHARAAMRQAGYDLGEFLEVKIERSLPFMGYTVPRGERYRIVVSGASLGSGMLEGLLVHEMSHIYRMGTGHVSHDGGLHESLVESFGKGRFDREYERKAVHDLLNNVQDLYADDIGVPVMRAAGILTDRQLETFLQDWVTPAPASTKDARHDRWTNAWLLANNARAVAQMRRHRVDDVGGKAARGCATFLAAMPGGAIEAFEYFRETLAGLPEDIAREDFRRAMREYLERFVKFVEAD
jgi:hypothetical protein